jgi:hypothetical protein
VKKKDKDGSKGFPFCTAMTGMPAAGYSSGL